MLLRLKDAADRRRIAADLGVDLAWGKASAFELLPRLCNMQRPVALSGGRETSRSTGSPLRAPLQSPTGTGALPPHPTRRHIEAAPHGILWPLPVVPGTYERQANEASQRSAKLKWILDEALIAAAGAPH
ncbi:hypothetical protein [Mesorhizobium sp. M0909]|uniref:hypothetical protein n=1 Tax=Mesorhizobium sp. M0909 TaxID=2957024 RepID=UPI00333C01A3